MSVDETRRVLEAHGRSSDVKFVDPDAVFVDTASGEQHIGREAIAALLRRLYRDAFAARAEATSVIIGDGRAVLEGHLVGIHVGEYAGVPASGLPVRIPLVVSYEISGGFIRRARLYLQVASFLQQVELARRGPRSPTVLEARDADSTDE